jgi:hypothetical protein
MCCHDSGHTLSPDEVTALESISTVPAPITYTARHPILHPPSISLKPDCGLAYIIIETVTGTPGDT